MKKVMIAAVILLPLIILMVLLISGTVVGSVQHIYVASKAHSPHIRHTAFPPSAALCYADP